MLILHVIAKMDPEMGGVGQAVRTMVIGLSDLGLQNEIVCLDSESAAFLANEKSIIHANGPGISPWSYSKDLSKWLKDNLLRFNIVIVHGLWLYSGFATRKAFDRLIKEQCSSVAQGEKIPKLFIMPHGMLDPYFQKAPGRRIKAIRNWIFWKLTESRLVNTADGVLFTCLTELQLARKPFRPYKPKREIVVGLGTAKPPDFTIDMRLAFINRSAEIEGERYILFLSRIHEKKGIDILIKAYERVARSNRNIPKLVVAGPGLETNYGQQIQEMVISKNLKNNIIFTGMLSGDAKWGAFYGCDAFILPSHQENFGIAVVEALACGKPVMISNQINIWKEILDSGGGLVTDDSLGKTQEMLETWINFSEGEKQEMGKSARTCYNKYFAINAASQHLKDAIIK